MPHTPIFAIPYPGPGDSNDAPADIFKLAAWLEENLPSSGSYTPVLTTITNVATATVAAPWMWSRIGDIVTVDGMIQIAAAANGQVKVEATLPVPSNLAVSGDLSGVIGALAPSQVGSVVGSTLQDRASIGFVASTTTGIHFGVHFAYRML